MQQRLGEQRRRRRRRHDRRPAGLDHLVLGDALDHDVEPAAAVAELGRVLEADQPRALGLQPGLRISTGTRGRLLANRLRRPCGRGVPWPLGAGGAASPAFSTAASSLGLQLRLGRQQITERELQLAGLAALGPDPEQPPLEQRVLVREAGQALLQRRHLRRQLGALGLEPAIVAVITSIGIAARCSVLDDTTLSLHVSILPTQARTARLDQ
ncbi:MAG: hypothetical protein HS111_14530 [Kofleriaceae bacterium]|nr:hypothetical protein [Kofleriaceae bacterium]